MDLQPKEAESSRESTQLEIAHQRMLSYLKALHIPVRHRYELAARCLELSEQEHAPDDELISRSLQHLQQLLQERQPPGFQRHLETIAPMPPLNRGGMVPVTIDRSGPFTFLFGIIAGLFRPPLRVWVLLALLAILAALYWLGFFNE